MVEINILPTIFATDISTFNAKLEKLQFAPNIHLDFMDGQFTSMSSVTFSDMKNISKHKNQNFEVHLMVNSPEKYLNDIKSLGIKKVLFHHDIFEKDSDITECIDLFKREKLKVFLVFNPGCDIKRALKFVHLIDGVMIMSVYPGKEGQEFIEDTYDKIAFLRRNVPSLNIQVDGGIKDTNIRKLTRNGANLLSIGSFISSSSNPKDSYEKLQYLIKG